MGQEITLTEDEETLFKGTIVQRDDEVIGGLLLGVKITVKDGLHKFDALLVNKAYNDTTAVAVVQDIVDNFSTGFTLEAPATSPSVSSIRFNYELPSKCLQAIAQQIGWDWFIDSDDVVHFFAKGDKVAPFEVTDDNGMLIYNSLSFSSDILQLKNSVFLRGGEYLDDVSEADALDKYTADGQQVVFNIGYKYSDVQVSINGVAKTVGADFLDDAASYDCLYNFQEKLIRFREDNKPTVGQIIKVFGNVYVPLIVQSEDSDSVTQYGRREGVKIDKTITSVLEAETACSAILDEWSQGSYEGSFKTREKGLRAGQMITINSASFGVNDTFKINRIRGKMNGHDSFEYEIQFIKSGNIDFTDIMVDLLGKEKKNLTIADNETVQRLRKFTDELEATDELISFTKTNGPYIYGPKAEVLIDSYNVSNYGATTSIQNGSTNRRGQSFKGTTTQLARTARFYLKKTGSPTGPMTAKIYAHTGTFGTNGKPTGSPLATSDEVDISTLSSASMSIISFNFTGANKITLVADTPYILVLQLDAGDASNYLTIGIDVTSPSHQGNHSYSSNGTVWNTGTTYDIVFYMVGESVKTVGKYNFAKYG